MALTSLAAGLAAELEQLKQAAEDMYVVNLCTAAAVAWLGYDIITTLPEEISYVWWARWSIPKFLYLFVRYYPLLSLLLTFIVSTSWDVTLQFCQGWLWYTAYNGTLLTAFLGEAMFLMRLYAAYQRSKPILVVIICLYTAELAIGIVTATLIVTSLDVFERPSFIPFPGCLVEPPNHVNLAILAWSVALGTTCIYFLLILYKFAYSISLKRGETLSSKVPIWELGTISPVIYAFLRDSAFYFFLVFAGNFINLLLEIIFRGRPLTTMGTNWLSAIYSVSASRLCLNTRESLQRLRFQHDTGWFDDLDDPDDPMAGSSRHLSPRRGQVQVLSTRTNSPTFVLAPNDGKVGLQRSTFESDRRQSELLTPPSTPTDQKRASSAITEDYEDYELVEVVPWSAPHQPVRETM